MWFLLSEVECVLKLNLPILYDDQYILSLYYGQKKMFGFKDAIVSVIRCGCNTPQKTEVMKSSRLSFLKKSLSPWG